MNTLCAFLGGAAKQGFSVGVKGSAGRGQSAPNTLRYLPCNSPSTPQGATVRAAGFVAAPER